MTTTAAADDDEDEEVVLVLVAIEISMISYGRTTNDLALSKSLFCSWQKFPPRKKENPHRRTNIRVIGMVLQPLDFAALAPPLIGLAPITRQFVLR